MMAERKTQREVAEYFGFKDKYVVKRLLNRQREKRRKLEAGIVPRPKGRPRKDAAPRDVATEQAYEIARLRMVKYQNPQNRMHLPTQAGYLLGSQRDD